MSEEQRSGAQGSFLWPEAQLWPLSDLENSTASGDSGAGGDGTGGEKKSHEKPTGVGDKNPKEAAVVVGKKRGRGGASRKGKGVCGGKSEGVGEEAATPADHEIHIWTERERRKKMRNMFSSLHDLIPQLPPKADKSTVVDEAISYIKTLQQTLQTLHKQKLQRFQAGTPPPPPTTTGLHQDTPSSSVATTSRQAAFQTREAFVADQVSANMATMVSKTTSFSASHHIPVVFQTWSSPNVVLNIFGDEAQFTICSPKKDCLFTNICTVLEKHKVDVVSAHVSSEGNRAIYMIQAHANGGSDQLSEIISVEDVYKQVAGEIMCFISSSS